MMPRRDKGVLVIILNNHALSSAKSIYLRGAPVISLKPADMTLTGEKLELNGWRGIFHGMILEFRNLQQDLNIKAGMQISQWV